MKNKVYVTDGRGNLDLTGRPIPELKSRDVLVEIAAVSLNFRDIPLLREMQHGNRASEEFHFPMRSGGSRQ